MAEGNQKTAFQVTVTYEGLCELVRQFAGTEQGMANGLCTSLMNAQEAEKRGGSGAKKGMLRAFIQEVDTQKGMKFMEEQAQTLTKLVENL